MEETPYKTLTDEQYMETMRHGCAAFSLSCFLP